ncbi:two-component system capsular synthesis sensor histidine kinase RcsC [Pseudomonas sp. 2848]|uniref:ATP-binding protein n=1 Tax=Pseudomonas sp. 2848 TaxID=2183926 RepID=UPI000DAEDB92|nr:ATP-binding protein [Pseudomonas sp. 2848]PZW79251.1 two-component system capsular synthesis sensor histidine kinase RcsC [Pseudomonas sp. 2848]
MRLKTYLQQINPLFSNPEAARHLLRLLALVLSAGILGGAYSFLLLSFNTDISQRRGYMSSAIAEAHTFFTNREALLESLTLSAITRTAPSGTHITQTPSEEVHLLLGNKPGQQWSLWLSQRMCDYLRTKQVNLLYVGAGPQAQARWLYSTIAHAHTPSMALLERLRTEQKRLPTTVNELWLADKDEQHTHLYIFQRLDRRDPDSGWLGLEIDSREVSPTLDDASSGKFMMYNADGMLVFSNSSDQALSQMLRAHQGSDFFGFIGQGLLPEYLVINKPLMSSDWQLVYGIDLLSILSELWVQLLGALLFCLLSISLMLLLIRRFEQRFITPTVQRIRALVESELFNRDVIETAPVALCVLRRSDGQVVLENHLAQQWLGEARVSRSAAWIDQAFAVPNVAGSDYFETSDGRHLYLSCAPTRYKGEDVVLCVFSDISARKQIEAALEDARRSADSANEAKTQFLATMSHEIRTPLYGVLGTLELLSRTALDGQQRDYLQAIEGSSATLLQLICDVLDVSKIEAGQLALEHSEFCVPELAMEVIQSYSAAARNKGLQLYGCLDPHLPERLLGDVNRIRQILNNLLSNAVKFTDCGRVVLRAKLLHREGERSSILWQVADTGKGIAEQDHASIFDPFYQSGGHTQLVPGTGLGLAICQRLTQLMNGQLRLVSELGLGSSFSLTLPLEVVSAGGAPALAPFNLLAERIQVVSPIHELAETFAGWLCRWGARAQIGVMSTGSHAPPGLLLELHPGSFDQWLVADWEGPRIVASAFGGWEARNDAGQWQVNLNDLGALHHAISQAQGLHRPRSVLSASTDAPEPLGLHVLVAEDNVINQLILRDQLEELGCSVALTCNGDQALQSWQREQFDLVLTDVNMPIMNGYELARSLRKQGCNLPIIGATANALRGEEELCLAAGMDRCLIKPFTLQALFNCLAAYRGSRFEVL